MKVFELQKAFQFGGKWHPTGGSTGTLYFQLERAQAQIVDVGPWTKRGGRRVWQTERMDLIIERKVIA